MSVQLTHLQIHWGLAGARDKFEDMVAQLIHVERPDSQRVRVVKGDAGLDSFEGELIDSNGVDVYQVKYFPGKIGDAQKKQIRESFITARDSKKFKTKSWTLCLPIDMSADETRWFEAWANSQAGTCIDIRKPWGAMHLEGLLLRDKNRAIRQAFFREENTELLRTQASYLEKVLHELTERGELQMTLTGVKARNAYRWTEDKMVVEVQLCYRLENVGSRSIPKWSTGGAFDLHDDELGKRFVSKEEFPRLGSGASYYRLDSTILPTTSLTTEHIIGVMVRRSERFDEVLPKILNGTSVTFWPITGDGPGDRTTVKLIDMLDWTELLPAFDLSYILALGRLAAE